MLYFDKDKSQDRNQVSLVRIPGSGHDILKGSILKDLGRVSRFAATIPVPSHLPFTYGMKLLFTTSRRVSAGEIATVVGSGRNVHSMGGSDVLELIQETRITQPSRLPVPSSPVVTPALPPLPPLPSLPSLPPLPPLPPLPVNRPIIKITFNGQADVGEGTDAQPKHLKGKRAWDAIMDLAEREATNTISKEQRRILLQSPNAMKLITSLSLKRRRIQ
uniref:Uncharacterized protein n=1 Tax=Chionoecetes opilio bacilliform virus TaxID=1825681 RepID=A0A1Q3DL17_9VIRU|nr:hypothetical protein [Chionoecetes opilio bacilliform virus]GAV93152.1 hypothetical protein SCV_028 [Chionoecetes opilio bacilliform virus]